MNSSWTATWQHGRFILGNISLVHFMLMLMLLSPFSLPCDRKNSSGKKSGGNNNNNNNNNNSSSSKNKSVSAVSHLWDFSIRKVSTCHNGTFSCQYRHESISWRSVKTPFDPNGFRFIGGDWRPGSGFTVAAIAGLFRCLATVASRAVNFRQQFQNSVTC